MDYRKCQQQLTKFLSLFFDFTRECADFCRVHQSFAKMKLCQVLSAFFGLIEISQGLCYLEKSNHVTEKTENTYDVCLSVLTSNIVFPKIRHLFLLQTINNVDWSVLTYKYPNLEVSIIQYYKKQLKKYISFLNR
jgi:hypothetical protein